MQKDPYAILGLSKSASVDDIKKAYRSMSKEWHPDKHKGDKKAEEKFKEINEAYETLNDPKKKQMYDQFGSAQGPQGGGGFGGFQGFGGANGFDFSQFSGMGGGVGDIFDSFFGGRREREQSDVGNSLQTSVIVTLQDVLHGVQVPLRLDHDVPCETCGGSGSQGGESISCTTCSGTGQRAQTVQSFFGRVQQRVVCPDCRGAGKVPKDACAHCKGEGRVHKREEVRVDVPPGIEDGQQLRLRGYGQAGLRGGAAGDLLVEIRVKTDPHFQREGQSVASSHSIPVCDAILGATVGIATLHGEVQVSIPAGTEHGQQLRIRGKGLPQVGRTSFGDHYVTINISIPKKLSGKERKLLEEWKEMH